MQVQERIHKCHLWTFNTCLDTAQQIPLTQTEFSFKSHWMKAENIMADATHTILEIVF